MKRKLKEWWNRYALAEFVSMLGALISATILHIFIKNVIVVAIIVTWLMNFCFYGIIVYRDLRERKRNRGKITFADYLKQARNTVLEFGPAEYIDSFLFRPFCLSLFPFLISNYTLAVFIGTVAADVVYFVPVIIAYELRKKAFKD